ncbi:MAG: aminotransferase class V-fold PLP-dependent enzyme, partial [bacterium]|nr:aminotransferase class V-fold PLP-dependent enzyme [bacterium]
MREKEKFKKKIFKYIKKFSESSKKERFIPGKTYINYAGRIYDEKELINLVDSSLDFWLTAGKYARLLEERLAKFLGMKYCLLTNSGSSANLLAISALTSPLLKDRRLRPGDEVITTACGFPTTLNPIIQNNLIPVFIDIEPGNYNIQVDKIEKAISKKTRAIFIAHTLGNPLDLDNILRIIRKYNLWFVEDNCDSLGSKYRGKYTGTFGHISTCSFYPAHHITTGEGGAVLTDDSLLRRII